MEESTLLRSTNRGQIGFPVRSSASPPITFGEYNMVALGLLRLEPVGRQLVCWSVLVALAELVPNLTMFPAPLRLACP
jgi:hypothetical protein